MSSPVVLIWEFPPEALTRNTSCGWVCSISTWWGNFRHKVTDLLRVSRSSLPVGESKLNESRAANGEINNYCDGIIDIFGRFLVVLNKKKFVGCDTRWNGPFRQWTFFETFGIPSEVFVFSSLPEWLENHRTICFFTLFPLARWWNTQLFR